MIDLLAIPNDLALIGWYWSFGLLHDPDAPISICPRSNPPPRCFDIARDWAWLRATMGAQREDAERAKIAKKPKKAKRMKPTEPVLTQEALGI